jgi:hypothetical protein
MKKSFLFLLFFCLLCLSSFGQDKVVLRNGDTLSVKVTKSTSDMIEFNYPNETLVNQKSKKEIKCIIYESGRKEECNTSFQIPEIKSKDDWEKVVITYLPSDVAGLTRVCELKATSGWGGSLGSSLGYKEAIKKLKKRAAAKGACVILITDKPNTFAAARGGGYQLAGVGYK